MHAELNTSIPHSRTLRTRTEIAKAKPAKKARAERPAQAMPEAFARKLLQLLATDDAFRRRFTKDIKSALLEVCGVDPQSALCWKVDKLASKKDIIAAQDQLLTMMTGRNQFMPVQLKP
jgi:putative modified peptide